MRGFASITCRARHLGRRRLARGARFRLDARHALAGARSGRLSSTLTATYGEVVGDGPTGAQVKVVLTAEQKSGETRRIRPEFLAFSPPFR